MRLLPLPLFGGKVLTFISGTPMNAATGPVRDRWNRGTAEQRPIIERIFWIAQRAGVRKIYQPDPHLSNAKCLYPDSPEFTQKITSAKKEYFGMELWRGPEANADAMLLPPWMGFWQVLADCAFLIMRGAKSGKLFVSHYGLASSSDWERALQEAGLPHGELRQHESVIDVGLSHFDQEEWPHLQCAVIFSIGAINFKHPVSHPEFGERNRALIQYIQKRTPEALIGEPDFGQISLKMRAKGQLIRRGVPAKNIFTEDGIDTFADVDENGQYKFFSKRRGDKERDGLMLVHHGL